MDVAIVTGEEHDTGRFTERLDAIEEALGSPPDRITVDTIHGVGWAYAALEDRRIEAVIPPLPLAAKERGAFRPNGSSSIPVTMRSGARQGSGSSPATARNPASGIVPTGAIARVAPSSDSVCHCARLPAGCISSPTTQPCLTRPARTRCLG